MLSDYLELERAKHGRITELSFRDKKRNGWSSQGSIGYDGKIKAISRFNSSYYYYYLQNSISRFSCYSCKYAAKSRVGDVTIGDYWCIEEVCPQVDARLGFSALLVNTEKGQRLTEAVKEEFSMYETSFDDAAKGNGNLIKPCQIPPKRNDIYARIAKEGYDAVARKEFKCQYVMPFIRRHVPHKIKKMLKRFMRRRYSL